MGQHGGKKKGDDNRPPAKTARDLCNEYGHHKKHYGDPFPIYGGWQWAWKCERCGEPGADEIDPPN